MKDAGATPTIPASPLRLEAIGAHDRIAMATRVHPPPLAGPAVCRRNVSPLGRCDSRPRGRRNELESTSIEPPGGPHSCTKASNRAESRRSGVQPNRRCDTIRPMMRGGPPGSQVACGSGSTARAIACACGSVTAYSPSNRTPPGAATVRRSVNDAGSGAERRLDQVNGCQLCLRRLSLHLRA